MSPKSTHLFDSSVIRLTICLKKKKTDRDRETRQKEIDRETNQHIEERRRGKERKEKKKNN